MEEKVLCVLGIGSVRCGPSIIASLATYFGERPLTIKFFDSDLERLDLFDRFARQCFAFNKAPHSLISTIDPQEAMQNMNSLIVSIGTNCARKQLKNSRRSGIASGSEMHLVDQLVEELLSGISDNVEVLSLLGERVQIPLPIYRFVDWPESPSMFDRAETPHQILRFLNGEEYPHRLFADYQQSPIKKWMESPESLPTKLGSRHF